MMEFTNEQRDYIESDIDTCVFLEACPGSGKTEVVAAKVAKEMRSWNKFPGGMAVLSFSNSATDELKARVTKHMPSGYGFFPHFLGTFDSFVYKNIVNPLSTDLTGYVGEGGDCSLRLVDGSSGFFGFGTKYGIAKQGKIYAHQFSINVKDSTFEFSTGDSKKDRILNSYFFEDWQVKDLLKAKNNMLSCGFATYGDIEYLAIKALSDKKFELFLQTFSKRWPLIYIDECQDLCVEQLMIIERLIGFGTKVHFVGDLNQAIYGFRDVDPLAVKEFVDKNNFVSLKLTNNFRSCQKIIDLCGNLTGRDNVIGRLTQLEPTCYVVQYEKCPTELIDVFEYLCNGFDEAVLVSRGHALLARFNTSNRDLKPVHKLALSISVFDAENMQNLKDSLSLFSEFIRFYLRESVKPNSFNCPQCVESSREWRAFLLSAITHLKGKGFDNLDKTWSSWVSAIKPEIQCLCSNLFLTEELGDVLSPLEGVNLRSPQGEATKNVAESLGNKASPQKIKRKATIHGAKGETHDVTILLSSPDARGQPGSHWKSWLKDPSSEAARFAYVASSRPKHRLVWAVKKLDKPQKEAFASLGFHFFP